MTPSLFRAELWLPRALPEVFEFFADAHNLQTLTPPWLDFAVLTSGPITMRPGAVINYRLKVHRLPLRWESEITVWEPPHRFVDVQRQGPYKLWIHEHRFAARDSGTLAFDVVRYAVPGGKLVDRLFVRRDIERIFQFRRQKLLELFGRSQS